MKYEITPTIIALVIFCVVIQLFAVTNYSLADGSLKLDSKLPALDLNAKASGSIEWSDAYKVFKSIIVFSIKLFLVVIETVGAVLKGLLPFLSKT